MGLTGRTEIEAFNGLLCLAGELRRNTQSLEGLRGTDGDDTGKFRFVMSRISFKLLITYTLE